MDKLRNDIRIATHRLWLRVKWCWRAWPFIVVFLLAFVHQIALCLFPHHRAFIHKVTGTAMQVIGGLVVLYSVNDNLGLFRKKSLLSVFIAWFRDFPLFGRPSTFSGNVSAQVNFSGTASASFERHPTTLEERVAALEHQLKDVSKEMLAKEAALNGRIDEVRDEMSQATTKHQTEILQLSDKLERTAVGGFKLQGFGVLLALYGAGISALT